MQQATTYGSSKSSQNIAEMNWKIHQPASAETRSAHDFGCIEQLLTSVAMSRRERPCAAVSRIWAPTTPRVWRRLQGAGLARFYVVGKTNLALPSISGT
jgi:hypothetical protein